MPPKPPSPPIPPIPPISGIPPPIAPMSSSGAPSCSSSSTHCHSSTSVIDQLKCKVTEHVSELNYNACVANCRKLQLTPIQEQGVQNPKSSLNVTYLIEIRPHKLHALGLLQQARPILLLQILLPQVKAHIGARGMGLGVLNVNLPIEF